LQRDFLDSKYTIGSGNIYVLKFKDSIKSFAQPNTQYAKCNNTVLLKFGYSCVTIGKWIAAFKIEEENFIVYEIILGSLLQ
jgi:hypothetical protein